MTVIHTLAGIVIPAANGPEIDARQVGALGWDVELRCDAAFSTAQIAACIIGSVATISVSITGGTLVWTGTVAGFGTRTGFSKVVLTNATATIGGMSGVLTVI
jgi:multidrug resistance efflux pump